jgi:hypothetical protein
MTATLLRRDELCLAAGDTYGEIVLRHLDGSAAKPRGSLVKKDSPLEGTGFEIPVPREPFEEAVPISRNPPAWCGSWRAKSIINECSQFRTKFAADSPLEEAGFEPLVPRDTTKFSTPAHVTSG